MSRESYEILVCSGPTCAGRRHADGVYAQLVDDIDTRALHDHVRTGRRRCFGFCRRGPNVYVRSLAPQDRRSALYHGVAATDTRDILDIHVLGHRVIDRLLRIPEDTDESLDYQRPDIRLAVAASRPPNAPETLAAEPNHGEEKDS